MSKKHMFGLLLGLLSVSQASPTELLWEIGTADNSASEFALAPGGYSQFTDDGMFVVGASDAAEDWPYVHPGPSDGWAGSRPHTFSVAFVLEAAPQDGDCTLRLDLVDTQQAYPPALRVLVNDTEFRHATPKGSGQSVYGDFAKGREHHVAVSFPARLLTAGLNEIAITNSRGSWLIYDWVGLEAPGSLKLARGQLPAARIGKVECTPLLVEDGGALCQIVRVPIRCFCDPTEAVVRITGAEPVSVALTKGRHVVEVHLPAVEAETSATLTVQMAGEVLAERELVLKPARKWVIYMLHHTHLDIGYTHVQTEVEAIQWRHLEQAIELARATATYPPGAQYKWLPEGLWAVDSYLRQAPMAKRREFIDAVRRGWIGLDALYGNELTALCRPEELFELTYFARELSKRYGLTIDSAMISDVPGYTWGLIPVLAHSGVKYLSIGPNAGHRIGYTLSEWGDKPFYWVSPSGKHKVLCWVHAKAYSLFHHSANRDQVRRGSDGRLFLKYIKDLEEAGFPYDMLTIRHNIGGDNGPPDPELPEFVKEWNATYAYPRFIIATTSEAFHDFEAKYGDMLAEVRGDFTPYWEDGAGSSAQETSVNREAAERLVQAQTLWAMLNPRAYPAAEFHAAWRNAILYDEHTWGAYNSISEPECDFAQQQWRIKQAFALDADAQSRMLLDRVLAPHKASVREVKAVCVFNTCSWLRTDMVVLPREWGLPGDLVKGADGQPVPSQRDPSGCLLFLAKDVPPLGAARFTVHAGEAHVAGQAKAEGNRLSNRLLTVTIDEATGAISSLKCKGIPKDLVDRGDGLGLNDYFYVAGRNPKDPKRNGPVQVTVKQNGPLAASVVVTSDAPGCRKLVREVRVIAGLNRVDISDMVYKEKVYDQEGVHFAFPFNVPDGVMRMDIPWAVVRPEVDQLPGSCKNYFTVQRWVDVSNDAYGVTWATVDAPLIEIGAITADPRAVGWLKVVPPSTTLYSYVMNNYWETNYKAAQEGLITFRYSLRPHGPYSQGEAQQFGIERSQPLIVIPAREDAQPLASLFRVEPAGVIVTSVTPSEDGRAIMVRLFNATGDAQHASVTWGDPAPKSVFLSDLTEAARADAPTAISMAPYEILTLRAPLAI